MDSETTDTLVWGLVGGLSFLVLLQGYELLTPATVDLSVKAGMTVVVTVTSTATIYIMRRRMAARADDGGA